jgi:hypothetical protein
VGSAARPARPQSRETGDHRPRCRSRDRRSPRLDAALDKFTRDAARSGAAALIASRGWGGLFGIFGTRLNLFGGLATIGGVHLLIDAVAEVAAVVIPATVALGAFGVAGSDAAKQIYTQFTNLHTVADATGKSFGPLSGALEQMHKAAQPQVYQLLGDALQVVNSRTGEFARLASGAGRVLDELGARAALALKSSGFSQFLVNAIPDLAKLGDIAGNVFGTIGNLLKTLPGYAQLFLTALDGITRALENVTASGIVQGVLKVGLAFHGLVIWGGLAVTAVVALAPKVVALYNALKLLPTALGLLAINPLTWVAAAVGALVALTVVLANAKDAAQKFNDSIQQMVTTAPTMSVLTAIQKGQEATVSQLNTAYARLGTQLKQAGGQAGLFSRQGGAVHAQLLNQMAATQQYQQGLQKLNQQQATARQLIRQVGDQYGVAGHALGLLNAAGVTSNQILDKSQWPLIEQEVAGVVKGYQAMGQTGTTLGNDLQVLNLTATDQYQAIQKLNQAWDSFIGNVTGSQTGFDTFALGVQTLGQNFRSAQAAAQTTSHSFQGLRESSTLAGAAMDGLSQASLTVNQAFAQSVTNGTQLIDSFRTAGLSAGEFGRGVRDIVARLLPFAKGSAEAVAQLTALAQEAGYKGPAAFASLVKWVGNTHGRMRDLKNITNDATIKMALLSSAMTAQGNYIAQHLLGDIDNAILKYSDVTKAADVYGKAIAQDGKNSDQARSARQRLINDLIQTGRRAGESTTSIAGMIAKILKIPLRRAIQITETGLGRFTISQAAVSHARAQGPGPFAAGGLVGGAGHGDTVPAMLTPGEVVVPKPMVRAGAVDHLRGMLPGFAAGGLVTSNPATVGTWAAQFDRSFAARFTRAMESSMTDAMKAAIARMQRQLAFQAGAAAYGGSAAAKAFAFAHLGDYGWRPVQWPPLLNLWNQESGWNPYAVNPSSGAYGIPQALGHGHPFNLGDYANQIRWGLGYIACMPLDSQILTREGWKSSTEVQPGDETIGFDPVSGRSRWNPVLAVHHYDDAPVARMHTTSADLRSTPNHRWLSEKIVQPGPGRQYRWFEFVQTQQIGTRHRLRLAARHEDDLPGLPITDWEAELLGWVAGDGCVSYGLNNRGGKRGKLDASVFQSKPAYVRELRALLSEVPHSEYQRPSQAGQRNPVVQFRLASGYARDLFARSGYERQLDAMVLAMSATQRQAFLGGLLKADGYYRSGNWVLCQNEGDVLDAGILAAFLLGHFSHLSDSGGQKHAFIGAPYVSDLEHSRHEDAGRAAVWCVTTGLGSWTARQSGQVFLTGNSRYGSPAAAWGHEVAFNWYDKGGFLPPGLSVALNTTGRAEPVGGPVKVQLIVNAGNDGAYTRFLVREIQKYVRVAGGGDPMVALGTGI